MRFQAWDTLQDSTDNSSIEKAETSLDRQEYFSQIQDTTDALSCHIHLPVWLWIMDPHSRAPKKNTSHGNEVLPQDTTHLIQRPWYQRGSPCQDPAGNWTTRRPPDHCKETQTAVVWSCFPFFRSGQNHLARHSEREKKTKQTEEEVRRQHQGMDRPGARQVPEGSGELGKMEKTGCKNICGAPMTLTGKDWWWHVFVCNLFLLVMMTCDHIKLKVTRQGYDYEFYTVIYNEIQKLYTDTHTKNDLHTKKVHFRDLKKREKLKRSCVMMTKSQITTFWDNFSFYVHLFSVKSLNNDICFLHLSLSE